MTDKNASALETAIDEVLAKDNEEARKRIDSSTPKRCHDCGWLLNEEMLEQMKTLPGDRGYGLAFYVDGEVEVNCPRCVTNMNLRAVMVHQNPPLIDKEMKVPLITLNMTSGMRVARTSTTHDPDVVRKAVKDGDTDPFKHNPGDNSEPMMILQFIVNKEKDHDPRNGPKTVAFEDGVYPDNSQTVAAMAMSKAKSVAVAIRILHEWLPVEVSAQLLKLGELAIASEKGLAEARASDMTPESMMALLKSMKRMGSDEGDGSEVSSLDKLLEILKGKSGGKSPAHEVVVADSPEGAVEGLKALIEKIERENGLNEDEDDEGIGFLSANKKGGEQVH